MAGLYNIELTVGATLAMTVTWASGGDPVDLTGYAAHMQVRASASSDNVLLDCSTSNYNDNSGNGYITLGTTNGVITFNVPSSVTSDLTAGKYKYDLHMFSADEVPVVTQLLYGNFQVFPSVTVDSGE